MFDVLEKVLSTLPNQPASRMFCFSRISIPMAMGIQKTTTLRSFLEKLKKTLDKVLDKVNDALF